MNSQLDAYVPYFPPDFRWGPGVMEDDERVFAAEWPPSAVGRFLCYWAGGKWNTHVHVCDGLITDFGSAASAAKAVIAPFVGMQNTREVRNAIYAAVQLHNDKGM